MCVGGWMCKRWKGVAMKTYIRQMYWGSHTRAKSALALKRRDPREVLNEHIQRALSVSFPAFVASVSHVAREERSVDGLLCNGYCITVEIPVGRPASSRDARTLECQIESLLSVALLDMLCPIDVDYVEHVQVA
jgi:hypothetical protein